MNQDFLNRLIATFKIEAKEHISSITNGLINFEQLDSDDEKQRLIEEVYREAHSLKGAARAVNLTDIESICQNFENVISAFKKREIEFKSEYFDRLHKAMDIVEKYLDTSTEEEKIMMFDSINDLAMELSEIALGMFVASTLPVAKPEPEQFLEEKIIDEPKPVEQKQQSKIPADAPKKKTSAAKTDETIRITTSKLDSLMLQAEELLSVKLVGDEITKNIFEQKNSLLLLQKEWGKIYQDLKRFSKLSQPSVENDFYQSAQNIQKFLEWNSDFFGEMKNNISALSKTSQLNSKNFSGMLTGLLEDMKSILMLPFSNLLDTFPKIVRDLSKDLGKECSLKINGGDLEVDRRILEEMKDPLIHLIRNNIDHGIETPDARKKKGKDEKGNILLSVTPVEGGKVEIFLSDDGAGMDAEVIKSTAVKKGIISSEEAEKLSESDALNLIFLSEVSTAKVITDVSGRGLGMAIVKEKVEKLGGRIKIETVKGKGTSFRITLPLTLATFRGILFSCAERKFIVSTSSVLQVISVKPSEIKLVENRETVLLNGFPISFVKLSSVLQLPLEKKINAEDELVVLALQSSDKIIGFLIDEILEELEVLVKPFNKQIVRLRNFSGATILGDGSIVPILNSTDLLNSAIADAGGISISKEEKASGKKAGKILVVDDSITSRLLLKDILESAGYSVSASVDGVDAFTNLKSDEFICVVSDVEMPRMNGFELTKKIRADKKYSEIPIVLVTGLAKKEDREKGIDSGANAYIVKSSFDQSNLIETIERLI